MLPPVSTYGGESKGGNDDRAGLGRGGGARARESRMSSLPAEDWVSLANCRAYPAEFFFPAGRVGVLEAKRVCSDCRVREECLDYAITHRIEHGVWGGQSERARQQIRRARRAALRQVAAEHESEGCQITRLPAPAGGTITAAP
ncbi:MAG TPA: WhiB family transcriptional regulator [Acidimicrobiales bacterium]|nr:WhiB family transcriptional regulator [Acidimicrobiales bacterium]